jgi:hypothetical protein
MKTSTTNDTTARRSFPVLAGVRDELRERRAARREYRALERDLASYTSRSDVDDLLAVLDRQNGPEAERIREILNRNVTARQSHPLAS